MTHDPYVSADALAKAGVEGVELRRRCWRMSDFVSVHAPLMPATRGLFNAAAFGKMKKGALLINTARGPLVDEDALIAALDAGHARRRRARRGHDRAARQGLQARSAATT